tara:strand:+ start:890 stop:1087 length:198 start_codon:yes stop_codon:yes gene_type:complete
MTDDGKMNVDIDPVEMRNVMKKYKKIKKYMRSPLYEVKRMDKTETVVTNLLKELETVPEDTKELD